MSKIAEVTDFTVMFSGVIFLGLLMSALEYGTAASVIASYEGLRTSPAGICSDPDALETYQDKVRRANGDIYLHRQTRKLPVISYLLSPQEWQSVAYLQGPCPDGPVTQ